MSPNPDSELRYRNRRRLCLIIVAVAFVWLGVLPRLARVDSLARQMEFFESRGIDPSARYYTDQPAGWQNAAVMEKKLQQNPEAFWQPFTQ
jgi:hypothetical protein